MVILNQLPQHGDEDVDRVRGSPSRSRETGSPHRVIRAVHLRATCDEKNSLGHFGRGAQHAAMVHERTDQRRDGADIQYIIRGMSLFARAVLLTAVGVVAAGTVAWRGGILGRQYEYEEDLYLSLDGTATLVVNSSLPALVALRGIDIETNPSTRLDLNRIRAVYQSPVTEVTRVSPPWRRAGRRFVQVRLKVNDVRKLNEAAPFAWSHYTLGVQN